MNFKYVVVGAGLAGLTIAERIASILGEEVLVIEKREHIGGNCYDEVVDGIIVHKYGPHLFHTDNERVWEYLSQFTEWRIYQHKVLGVIDGMEVPIPFNLNSLYKLFPPKMAEKLEEKLVTSFGYGKRIPIGDLLKEQDKELQFLAQFVYDKIFKNYSRKQWGMDPSKLGEEVFKRVPVVIGRDDRYFTDRFQGVPKKGYTYLFRRMIKNKKIKLLLNTDAGELISLDEKKGKIKFMGKEFKGILVFTGELDRLFEYKYGPLPYRTLQFEVEKIDKLSFQKVGVVNYPNNYKFTRITEFKHIHPISLPYSIIMKEFPASYNPNTDIPYYPIPSEESREKYHRYLQLAHNIKNLILIGRLAEYRYYNMDAIVERALEVFEKRILSSSLY